MLPLTPTIALSALLLIGSASAIPLQSRAEPDGTPYFCTPLVSGNRTTISYDVATREKWTPINQTESGFDGVGIVTLGSMAPEETIPFVNVQRADVTRNTVKVKVTALDDDHGCILAVNGELKSGSCFDTLGRHEFFVTCSTCNATEGYANQCQFQSAFQGECFSYPELNEPAVLAPCDNKGLQYPTPQPQYYSFNTNNLYD